MGSQPLLMSLFLGSAIWASLIGLADRARAEQVGMPEVLISVAYFQGGERLAIKDLRQRILEDDPGLTELEYAIAAAANKVGVIEWPTCGVGGNASLIQLNGRDAVIASLHLFVDQKTGTQKGGCDWSGLNTAQYYINGSYLDMSTGKHPADYIMQTVQLESPPLRSHLGKTSVPLRSDWIVYFLIEQVSDRLAPDSQTRGAFQFADLTDGEIVDAVIIGFDPVFSAENGRQVSYEVCKAAANVANGTLFHDCGTGPTSSSSLLGIFQGGEIRLGGIHAWTAWETDNMSTGVLPRPTDYLDWNRATLGASIDEQVVGLMESQ